VKWYLPCKLGEQFIFYEFYAWKNGMRCRKPRDELMTLYRISPGMEAGWSGLPEWWRDIDAYSGARHLSKFVHCNDYFIQYQLEISDYEFEYADMSNKVQVKKGTLGRLIGLLYEDEGVLGEYALKSNPTKHFKIPLNFNLEYELICAYCWPEVFEKKGAQIDE